MRNEAGVTAVGLDHGVDPAWANTYLPKAMPVQGNLDPLSLIQWRRGYDSLILIIFWIVLPTGRIFLILGMVSHRPHRWIMYNK